MKGFNRVFGFTALLLILLTNFATAQAIPENSFEVRAKAGRSTATTVFGQDTKFNFLTHPNGDGILDYYTDMFMETWGHVKECFLEKESVLNDGITLTVVGRGKYSGKRLGSEVKASNIECIVSVSMTKSGGRYLMGKSMFQVRDKLGIFLVDPTAATFDNNWYENTYPITPASPIDD